MTVDENIRDAASISDAQPHSIAFAFGGVFPHYKGDSNTTKLTIKRQILAQNDQFNDKTPPRVRRCVCVGGAKGGTENVHSFATFFYVDFIPLG